MNTETQPWVDEMAEGLIEYFNRSSIEAGYHDATGRYYAVGPEHAFLEFYPGDRWLSYRFTREWHRGISNFTIPGIFGPGGYAHRANDFPSLSTPPPMKRARNFPGPART